MKGCRPYLPFCKVQIHPEGRYIKRPDAPRPDSLRPDDARPDGNESIGVALKHMSFHNKLNQI